MSIIRSYARNIARNRMKAAGYRRINKGQKAGSYFSNHWREELRSSAFKVKKFKGDGVINPA